MGESEHAKTLFFEALALIDSCNFRDAEQRLREALRLAPRQAAVLTNLSIVLMQQGKRAEARDYAEQAAALNSNSIEARLVLLDGYMHAQEHEAALAACDKILALDPAIAEIHNNRGIVLERLGRYAEAVDSCDRALAYKPGFAGAYLNRGNALRQLERQEDALVSYDRALALVPDLAEAWLGRGNALVALGRSADALTAYDQALAESHDFAAAWLGRGNALSKLKRSDEALAAYDRAIAVNSNFAEAWLGRGSACRDLTRYGDALAAFDAALALRPGFAAAWLGRGNVFFDRQRFADALGAYDKALTIDSALPGGWLGRADTLRLLARVPEAIAAYRQALTFGADAETIKFRLAALGAEPSPTTPPERFVADLFDSFADRFDHHLVEILKYRIPGVLADAVKRHAPSAALDILDMGCGTGLAGSLLRPMARTLTGVDLSPNMLEKAQQRQVYDRLIRAELVHFLETHEATFDLAIAADVFIYLGDLSSVFAAVRRRLNAGGLFCFSVEAAEKGDFTLRATLRYAHSEPYLRSLAERHRFAVETIEPQVVRRDAGADVDGYLAVMRASH